jgi:hypothetical protein
MTPLLSTVVHLARVWTRVYTSDLDPAVRDTRRAEIESDLWESHEDARHRGHSASAIALEILGRLLLGVPHDVLWSLEQPRARPWPVRRVAFMGAVAVALLAALWVVSVLQTGPLPPPPPSMTFIAAPPPAPPPPPPPGSVVRQDGPVVGPPLEPRRR